MRVISESPSVIEIEAAPTVGALAAKGILGGVKRDLAQITEDYNIYGVVIRVSGPLTIAMAAALGAWAAANGARGLEVFDPQYGRYISIFSQR